MSCNHKFHNHHLHSAELGGLLPTWKSKTLIIGTFNPENKWHSTNEANYFYGRDKNYFWSTLPRFAGLPPIRKNDVVNQAKFLSDHEIAVTDLLISIEDADLTNQDHIRRIVSVKDDELERFNDLIWNTKHIINYIKDYDIKAVYFTKLGDLKRKKPKLNSFEEQIRLIETVCNSKGIYTNRLHTPSGQGLREGTPRGNVLVKRWYDMNGGDKFPFLDSTFDIDKYTVV